jgi:hypothetical protein
MLHKKQFYTLFFLKSFFREVTLTLFHGMVSHRHQEKKIMLTLKLFFFYVIGEDKSDTEDYPIRFDYFISHNFFYLPLSEVFGLGSLTKNFNFDLA